jgi:hypothetical protein
MSRTLVISLMLCALAACANVDPSRSLRAGVSSRADVVTSQGQPTRVWQDDDGGKTLEYAEQPFGQRCWMFKLSGQGQLLSLRDGLLAVERDRVQAGMTADQVSRLLGQERSRVFFSFSEEDVWDWNIAPDQIGELRRFNVHFKDKRVVRTSFGVVFRERPSLLKN